MSNRADIFGVSREIKSSKELGSSEFAVISMGNGKPTLIQDFSYTYQRETSSIYEVGSSAVYFQTGRSSGSAQLNRIVGRTGFQSLLEGADECGTFLGITVQLGGGTCNATPSNRAKLNFDSCVLAKVGGSFQSGQLNIAESAEMLLAGMRVA